MSSNIDSTDLEMGQAETDASQREKKRLRRRLITRWILAGPAAFIIAVLVMAAMPMWVPAGDGNVNHLAFSVLFFPAVWAAIVLYALLAENLKRASVLLAALFLINGIPVVMGVLKLLSAMQAGEAA